MPCERGFVRTQSQYHLQRSRTKREKKKSTYIQIEFNLTSRKKLPVEMEYQRKTAKQRPTE